MVTQILESSCAGCTGDVLRQDEKVGQIQAIIKDGDTVCGMKCYTVGSCEYKLY